MNVIGRKAWSAGKYTKDGDLLLKFPVAKSPEQVWITLERLTFKGRAELKEKYGWTVVEIYLGEAQRISSTTS